MIGLGVIGRNLVLNMADQGFSVIGFDKSPDQVKALRQEIGGRDIKAVDHIEDMITAIKSPKAVMMLVPAGPPVDSVIKQLIPLLNANDILIDGGNSHYTDTELRYDTLKKHGIHYL